VSETIAVLVEAAAAEQSDSGSRPLGFRSQQQNGTAAPSADSHCPPCYTHSAHGVLDVSPGVVTGHLEGSKNPDGPNLGIHIFVYVYKVHMCTYMLRLGGGMIS
jgi:hypothetical protein